MSPLRSPLFWRLLISFCVANLLVLVLGGFLARRFIDYSSAKDIDWSTLAQQADRAYAGGGNAALAQWIDKQRQQGIEATLFAGGHELQPVHLPPPVQRSLPVWLLAGRDVLVQPWPGAYVSVQQVGGNRQFVAYSRIHARTSHQYRQTVFLIVQLALSLLLIGVAGWWVARSVARPVEALRGATRRMAAGELSARVATRWSEPHHELGQLARDFNGMAARIEALIEHERGVLQDLSHEVRSPLARLQVILELLQRSDDPQKIAQRLRDAEREIARLDRMTEEMLALSRLESGLPGMQSEPFDLDELVADSVAAMEVEARARDVRLHACIHSSIVLSGNPTLIRRAIENLLVNAIKFSPAGGLVNIEVRGEAHGAVLLVRDHGPGVPEAELAPMFRPFFRGSNAARAEGNGLGLAIVQRVATAHSGDVRARNLPDGGLCVTLRLPRMVDLAADGACASSFNA